MDKCYIIVLWHNGIPHFYQTNEKVAWCFEHGVKAYVRLGSAISAAKKIGRKYLYDKINIHYINYSQTFNASDFVQGKFDKDIVHIIAK
jgi:hypothetical protein